jgi:hypothetical protein
MGDVSFSHTQQAIRHAVLSADQRKVVAIDALGTVYVWDAREPETPILCGAPGAHRIGIGPPGPGYVCHVAAAGAQSVRVFEIESVQQTVGRKWDLPIGGIHTLAFVRNMQEQLELHCAELVGSIVVYRFDGEKWNFCP